MNKKILLSFLIVGLFSVTTIPALAGPHGGPQGGGHGGGPAPQMHRGAPPRNHFYGHPGLSFDYNYYRPYYSSYYPGGYYPNYYQPAVQPVYPVPYYTYPYSNFSAGIHVSI